MKSAPDLIILGSGSTAFAAALRASSYGARVLMCEKSVLGGTCINWGCIPSKTLIHAALFNYEAHLGAGLGLPISEASGGLDYERLAVHRDEVVLKLRQERYLDVLKQMPGLEVVKGTARFEDLHTIRVDERRFRADRFLVAVGGVPRVPAIPGLDQCGYLTSRSALLTNKIPASLVMIGGGVIAVELGQMYHRLGCRLTILEHGPRLLPAVEREPAEAIQDILAREGLAIVPDATVCSVGQADGQSVVEVEVRGERLRFSGEKLLLALGTTPATADIGLNNAGVEMDGKGFIKTDSSMRTSAAGIWAAGDVTGGMMIATVGAREGIVAVDDMFNPGCGCTMDYLTAPMAIFTDPEVGMVGHGEESARQAGYDVMVNTIPASAIPKAHVTGATAGVIKMVADRATGRLLGVHLACHRGAEMINEAALALHLKATVEDLATTMHVYPSIGEGLKLCAQGFSRDLSKLSCCAE
ncbi:mercury(II) reductase [Geobacter sp. SVR]|uniref:mercury(II) reductase n=1 Tax=Geobacter sp. SVR TaxID=2495594 RepID=UPI00143F0124|nr:mercury(II) reductase [Geobacter sp. SVR]BCS53113.1 mercury(II) reductase [Geobacter sp. SVR]GCF84498.1 mercury(II) reductase [Geobacter sp. SVR]